MSDAKVPWRQSQTARHTIPTIIEALRQSGGVIAAAANKLNLSRASLYDRINANKRLQEALAHIREETIDLAEGQLLKGIRDGDKACIMFFLKTIGKSRGYTEKVVTVGDPEQPVIHQHLHATFKDASYEDLRAAREAIARLAPPDRSTPG